jgi:serine/threonine-protein kinase ULK/ATG1
MSKELHGKATYIQSTKKIGKGAFSKVYKGFNIDTDTTVAIKCIEKDTILNKLKNRLKSEIKLHSDFDHKNIIKLYDFIEDNDFYYIILEYCSHGDLHKYIKYNKLNSQQAQNYSRQLADGLKYLRSKNIVHRDLKPHNILITESFVIKITDFNFARELWDQQLAETLCGSPLYMAPEIIETNSYTNKSDLWSVGMIIYEMLHSHTPYDDAINPMDLLRKIKKREIVYTENLESESIDLLRGLLVIDYNKRLDWDGFFNHRWILQTPVVEENDSEYIELFDSTALNNIVIIDDYYRSTPMDIPVTKSSSTNFRPSSLPAPTTITKNIVEFMTSSVGGIVRGTFNYLSQ